MKTFAVLAAVSSAAHAFNNPPGVKIWCGKAYESDNASFPPGGWLHAPPQSAEPLLDLGIRPRMSFYASGESSASFIVDAPVSNQLGKAYRNSTQDPNSLNETMPFTTLSVDISDDETGQALVSGATIPVNSTANELGFSLSMLPPRLEPYSIALVGASADGAQSYTAQTHLLHLPPSTDGGSMARLDSLTDAILISEESNGTWTAVFPYGFYTSWSGFLEANPQNVNVLQDAGYNLIHAIPDGSNPLGFNQTELEQFLDRCDEVGMYVMYDMRYSYQNASAVENQVNLVQKHKSLLLWYTGDEPDGNSDPLNATKRSYDQIKNLDPYHPVSLCLNCYNFYYEEYTSGADIVMEDVYPIAVNTTFSTVYDTVCNTTYGVCGCDDCEGAIEDVSTRQDLLRDYQRWIGGAPKPRWGVPQAFGDSQYWTRDPTPDEESAMTLLRMNHGAKAIVMWTWPTTTDLANLTSQLAKVLTSQDVTAYTLAAIAQPLAASGEPRLDAAGWIVGDKMLVSVVCLEEEGSNAALSIELPTSKDSNSEVQRVFWGTGWTASGSKLTKTGSTGLEVDVMLVQL